MSFVYHLLSLIVAVATVVGGLLAAPYAFADRLSPGAALGSNQVGGIAVEAVPQVLIEYEKQLQQKIVEIVLRGSAEKVTLGELGLTLDIPATSEALIQAKHATTPVVKIDRTKLDQVVAANWLGDINLPTNATLQFNRGSLITIASAPGEGIDVVTLEQDILARTRSEQWHQPIELVIISTPPIVHEGEVEAAKDFALTLLRDGLTLSFGEETWQVSPFTLQRLLRFVPQIDPSDADNYILGVTLAEDGLASYLVNTIAPEINQPAVNARFERKGDRVTQFAVPQEGRQINLTKTKEEIIAAVLQQETSVNLVVETTEPAVKDVVDIEALGVANLLATGTSDFVGSPANRIHNIQIGTSRYHGLLIPPGESFSFNEFLGPVDGAHGFKPELVIKHNVTTPEYGGGLCQVSTTAFRAALRAGLEITQRRNHAYPVRYYGTPGLDATIYPPYTDLRFTNNTPGYILIQTRIEGTKLSFDFWGTDDGREVEITDPYLYDRQANGAVKAIVNQTVTRSGEVLVEDRFYSRYKSPDLFPKVVAADDPSG